MNAQPGFTPFVHVLGEGPQRVLALHCTLAFGGAWGGMAKAMGTRVTFVAPDLPSHGKSPDWDGQSDLAQTVLDTTAAMMDPAPMDVIGHSFGAMTALRLAVAYPARVRSITLFEPVFFAVAKTDDPEALELHSQHSQPFYEAISTGDMALAARAFNGMWSDTGGWEQMTERSRAAMTRAIHVVPATVDLLLDDTDGILAPGRLDALPMPVSLVRGQHTHPAIIAVLDGLHRRIPGSTLDVIAEAGHMGPITHPAEMAALFDKTLRRASG